MTQPEGGASERISALLGRLQSQPDPSKITLQGRATGRDEQNLHLAHSTGVVEIPLEQVEDVTFLNTNDPTLVSVLVKDATAVRHLMKVQPALGGPTVPASQAAHLPQSRLWGGGAFGGGLTLPPIHNCSSFTDAYIDSATTSMGVLDATDDVTPVLQCDDVSV